MGERIGFSNIQFQTILTEGIWAMYRNRKCTDIVFDCKGTKFNAHRLIVSIVAPEIEELLIDSTLKIDVHAETFKLLVEYIYKGRTSVPKDQLDEIKKGAEKIRLKSLADSIDAYISLISEAEENESNLEKDQTEAEPKEICENAEEVLADSEKNKMEIDEMKSSDDDILCLYDSSQSATADDKVEPVTETCFLKQLLMGQNVNFKEAKSSADLLCMDCDFVGDSRRALVKHRRIEHGKKPHYKKKRKEKHFKCPECDFVSNKHLLLSRHIQNKHSTDRPYACNLCDYRSKNSSDLGKHLRYHSEHRFECTICGKLLKTQTILNGHLKLHTTPDLATQKPHVCQFCDYRCSRRDSLTNHLKKVHDFEAPKKVQEEIPKKRNPIKEIDSLNEIDYECQYCEYKTNKHVLYLNHLAVKHELDEEGNRVEPKFQCINCDFKGMTARHLGTHTQQYHKKDSFRCQHCSFTTYNKTLMTYHMRGKHLDHKPFVCETCGLRCISTGQLKRHKLIHGDEKYVCDICNNSYSLRLYLRRHIRIMHDAKGPQFMCDMCAFKTRTKDSLKQHMTRMHSEDKPCPRTRRSVRKQSVK